MTIALFRNDFGLLTGARIVNKKGQVVQDWAYRPGARRPCHRVLMRLCRRHLAGEELYDALLACDHALKQLRGDRQRETRQRDARKK